MATMARDTTSDPVNVNNQATSPRKRRRRAPTTGAADDCFACQDRHSRCDRRRPYCTQCLDQGKDCSGYKTTLTWGVGVASRGKLRGLALPIAKSKKVAQSSDETTVLKKPQPGNQTKLRKSSEPSIKAEKDHNANLMQPPSAPATTTTFGFINVDPNSNTASPMLPPPSFVWSMPNAETRASQTSRSVPRPVSKRGLRRHSLEPLHVSVAHDARDIAMAPVTAGIFGGYGSSYENSVEYSPIGTTFQTLDGPMPIYKDFNVHQSLVASPMKESFFLGHEIGSWPSETMTSSLSSDTSSRDYSNESDSFFADPEVANTLDDLLTDQNTPTYPFAEQGSGLEVEEETPKQSPEAVPDEAVLMDLDPTFTDSAESLMLSRSLPSLSIGRTPGLRFLINYYDKVISPVIVAFDGPTNPYRAHILRLAVESETLQHAIAALSASNLRMRREHNPVAPINSQPSITDTPHDKSVRKSSIAHNIMNDGIQHKSEQQARPGVPSAEELLHKGQSIRALNAQLADPLQRKDDSILATLLILCLYHICDTGVAKFRTQFAGVKKILALRGGNATRSKETNWLTTMFTWFDAMTATVNDREGQFTGEGNDVSGIDHEDWALENLAGCDGRLFRTIAKLGRLNLLSQNKPVTGSSPDATPKMRPQLPPSPPKNTEYYSMDYNRFDGNGWAAMLDEEGEEDMHTDRNGLQSRSRSQFWTEWSSIRTSLHEFEFDPSSLPAPMHDANLETNRQDLSHISQSFRYSALLYTERLAYPHLPSSSPNFQNLVAQALFHISNVKSDVYLLWPLFITGTECVDERHRQLIRSRCLDIQKDSGFFNNISGLELLERIWRDDQFNCHGGGGGGTGGEGGGVIGDDGLGFNAGEKIGGRRKGERQGQGEGFRWRGAMTTVDGGEYIVI
ncbi:hypothetical protein MMC09_006119 [Bachmanniomyces sp. S44760]|nr:hypothetical protein [Bachmanniomyces sp. S44760]